jgi:hypothetical protein
MKIFAPFLTLVIVGLALLLAYDTLVAVVKAVVIGAPVFVGVAGVVVLAMWAMKTRAGHIKTIAEAREIERRSLVQFDHSNGRIVAIVHDGASVQPLDFSLEAAYRITNGPNPGAMERIYEGLHGRRWRVEGPTPLALPEPEPPAEPILDALLRCKRGMIIGPSDAGKTSTLRHLAEAARDRSRVLVIDPKAYNGKWPGCVIIGQGGDYGEIERAAGGLVQLMRIREERMGQGHSEQCQDEIVTVIVDEWLLLRRYCPNAPQLLVDLITESRGSNIHTYLVNHDDSVEAWGIRGLGGIRAGVEKFILEYNQQTTRRRAWLVVTQMGQDGKMERTVKPLVPAGPYYDNGHPARRDGNGSNWTVERPPVIELSDPEPADDELRVLSMRAGGASVRQVAREVWGIENAGSHYVNRVEEIERKWAGWRPEKREGNEI